MDIDPRIKLIYYIALKWSGFEKQTYFKDSDVFREYIGLRLCTQCKNRHDIVSALLKEWIKENEQD